MAYNYKRMLQCIHVNKNVHFTYKTPTYWYAQTKTTTKSFSGHTDIDKWNILGLQASAIPRRVTVQHIKGIANILADLVSRLKAVGLYHDIDSSDCQQEFSKPFEPLPPVEPVTHTPIEVNEVSLHLTLKDLCKLKTHYITHPLHRLVMMSDCHWEIGHPLTFQNWKKLNVPTWINTRKSDKTTTEWWVLQKYNTTYML